MTWRLLLLLAPSCNDAVAVAYGPEKAVDKPLPPEQNTRGQWTFAHYAALARALMRSIESFFNCAPQGTV